MEYKEIRIYIFIPIRMQQEINYWSERNDPPDKLCNLINKSIKLDGVIKCKKLQRVVPTFKNVVTGIAC